VGAYSLFKDHERTYVFISVVIILLSIGVAAWYETDYIDKDSWPETVASIFQWLSPAIALSITILALREVGMVLAERYKAQRYEEGRQQGRQEGLQEGRAEISKQVREWDERRKAAEARGEPFDEPLPIEAEGSSD
jgi:hypothetical protein